MKSFDSKIFIVFILLVINCHAQSNNNFYYNYKTLDINNIHANINNLGNIDKQNGDRNVRWKKLGENYIGSIIYQQGNTLIGNYNNNRNMAYSGWFNMYAPGPILNGKPAMIEAPHDSAKYRVYKITRDQRNEIDYNEWPVEFGAPSYINGSPKLFGDQMLWTVYNSYDHTVFGRFNNNLPHFADSISPIPIEIQQLTFAKQKEFEDVVFFEFTIINKGNYVFQDVISSIWTDIDFRDIFHNYAAVDTTLQLAYCWGRDDSYGIAPAVGYQLLYGPKVTSIGDKALFRGKEIENYKNLKMSSFHGIVDDAQPGNHGDYSTYFDEIWNISHGLESDGTQIINPKTNEPTKFYWSGDPITNNGWIYTDEFSSTGGGAGFYMFTGPFDIEPNDTQWIMLALFPALGETNLESITKLRELATKIKNTPYEDLIKPSDGEINYENIIPNDFEVFQNYPNPFNSGTTIKFNLPNATNINIVIYNSLGEKVKTVVNQSFEAGKHSIKISMNEFSSGVYFCQIIAEDFMEIQKMVFLK